MSDRPLDAAAGGGQPVSVVVVARNEEGKIADCLRAIAAQDYEGGEVEILLVDGGSSDGTIERARSAAPGVRILYNPGGTISSSRNLGWRAARHRLVAYTDADCVVPPHWLRVLTAALGASDAAAVGGANVPPAGTSRFYDALAVMLDTYAGSRGSVQGRRYPDARRVDHLPGLNVLFRREALEAVGGYDERFGFIGEDEDLSHRLRAQGFELRYVPGATVVHRQRSDLRSWLRNMYLYGKGRTWLLRRHPNAFRAVFLLPPLLPLLLWLHLPAVALLAAWYGLRARRPGLIPRLFALLAGTHLAYGIGEWAGLLTAGDTPEARRSSRWGRIGFVVLKNAGNKGDEAIFVAICRRWIARRNRRGLGFQLYAVGFGPSGVDVRLVPPDLAGVERLAADLCCAAPRSRRVTAETLSGLGRFLFVLVTFRGLVFAGGHWIHDLRPAFHAAICGSLLLGRLMGTRTGLFCVGSGPVRSGWARAAVRLAFGRRSLLVVRDPASERLYRSLGRHQVRLAADAAFDLPRRVESRAPRGPRALARAAEVPVVGLSPCAWFRFENLYRRDPQAIEPMVVVLRELIDGLRARGCGVLLVPTMNPEDRSLCERLLPQPAPASGLPGVELLESERLTPSQIQERIAGLHVLVSMRLHPVIFAINAGVPFVALRYADKVEELCRRAELEDRLVFLEGDWGGEALRLVEALDRDARDDLVGRLRLARRAMRDTLGPAYDALWDWAEGGRRRHPRRAAPLARDGSSSAPC